MIEAYFKKITQELNLQLHQVAATAELLAAEATVPFIARYRKEATGSLDEVAITAIRDRLEQLEELDKRRAAILKSLEERGLLTDELQEQVLAAETMSSLEDVYLPYRPKRRTRATVAKEKGLEPLASLIFAQAVETDPRIEAQAFIDPEKGVNTIEEALAGARDIMAEWISEDQTARAQLRTLFEQEGLVRSKVISGKEEEGAKFQDYFDWEEKIVQVPSHRLLAMRRGETEGILSLKIRPSEEIALARLEALFLKGSGPTTAEVRTAVHDGYQRLLSLSLETEVRLSSKQRADVEAIKVFADNLRELLLAPALGQKRVLAIDPGFRTGGKVACLDAQGQLLHTDTIQIIGSAEALEASGERIVKLCKQHKIEAIAIGNGTASRETEAFVRALDLGTDIPVIMVNESGASIYSASEAARREFPDLDLTFRGAVSIGRRLTDPLAELVKIDPKSIGVGQYQHDVNQADLKRGLNDVVISAVNAVGVDVNTASPELLTYVSGLGPQLAKNIVKFRNENGPLLTRQDIMQVPRLGPKAFEQAAGFLRIRGGPNPLDASAVHPESYPIVLAMAADLNCQVDHLLKDAALRQRIDLKKYMNEKFGLPTLTDIIQELAKPGRDPRREFTLFSFAKDVLTMEDLASGMRLPGIVTNVTAFGAFVDVGVHQDGLVHISELADGFVKDPSQVVKVHQRVMVTVLDVDLKRKRISLSMREKGRLVQAASATDVDRPKADRPTRGGRKPDREPRGGQKPSPAPFNNPFNQLLKK